MPRPEKPIAPNAPFGAFALRLRALRRGAGNPTYRAMAARIKHSFSVSTLAGAASGDTMPNLNLTLAYAEACHGDRQYWTEQWFIARGADRLWPDEPWAATPPDPAQAADPAAYVALLRELRLWAGSPSLQVLSRLTGHARSSLGEACAPHRTTMPSEALVMALVRGCLLYAYRSRPWLREPADSTPDGWIRGVASAWLRTRHRLELREAARPRPTVRPDRAAASADHAPEPEPNPTPAPDQPETPVPPPDEAARAPRWGPLSANHPPEVIALASSLRTLFDALGEPVRMFAVRHHYDASTVSRYLSGRRVPPMEFVRTLLASVAAVHKPLTPEAEHHLLTQHSEALRITDPRTHEVTLLQERLRSTEIARTRLLHHTQQLEHLLDEARARIDSLLRDDPGEAA